MTRWGSLLAIALGVLGCSFPKMAYVLPLDPSAAYASEVPRSVARALAGQGWVPAALEDGSVVSEWRDLVGFDDEDFPRRRVIGRLIVTIEREQLVLRLESRVLSASCAGAPHPPSDLNLVGCTEEVWPASFYNTSLEALANELAFTLDTSVVAVEQSD